MNEPLVSVIIPNYNHAPYLQERIESILRQTYRHFEIIMLDDCSTDHSRKVMNTYREHPQVTKIIFNEVNSGSPFVQWKRGIQEANGELVWIAESDDSCHPDMLRQLVGKFEGNPTQSFAFCQCKFVDRKGEITDTHSWRLEKVERMNGKAFIRKHLRFRNRVWNASCALFRKSFALACDDEYIRYRTAGDWLFWIMMAEQGEVTAISTPLNYFRQHPGSTTKRSMMSGLCQVEAKKVFDYCLRHEYIGRLSAVNHTFKMLREIKYRHRFESEAVQQQLIDLWADESTLKSVRNRWYLKMYHPYFYYIRRPYKKILKRK